MQSGYTGYITSEEWRWVIIISLLLVSLAFLPFLWVLIIGLADSQWQFMGALHHFQIGAASLSQILQGQDGLWLTHYLHTPELHSSALLDPLSILLGQTARITALPPIAMFHVARVGTSIFMYLALYQLAATIWMRVRTRRIFFVFTAVGSGLGWIMTPISGSDTYIDLITPQAFPFLSSLVNVHYPLAVACLALLTSVIIVIFRPGEDNKPTINNGGGLLAITSMLLVIVDPLAFIPILIAFFIRLGIEWYTRRQIIYSQFHWLIWLIVPALPWLAYDLAVVFYNDVAAGLIHQQSQVPPPDPLVLILSLGLPLFAALPGLYRGIYRFEPDGDRFMVIWLAAMIIFAYLPFGSSDHFLTAIALPVMYFLTRSIEDFWFKYISRRHRYHTLVALIPVMAASNLLALSLPVQVVSTGNFDEGSGMLLQRDYTAAFNWLDNQIRVDDVVLASPDTSLWIPVWVSQARVMYGYPAGTLEAGNKRQAILRWYRERDIANCTTLLDGPAAENGLTYRVRFVIYGPQEQDIGDSICTRILQPLRQFGSVRIYQYN